MVQTNSLSGNRVKSPPLRAAAAPSPVPSKATEAINRLRTLRTTLESLRFDLRDRLIAAREPMGVPTPPGPPSDQSPAIGSPGVTSYGCLFDEITQLELMAMVISEDIGGFRELFG